MGKNNLFLKWSLQWIRTNCYKVRQRKTCRICGAWSHCFRRLKCKISTRKCFKNCKYTLILLYCWLDMLYYIQKMVQYHVQNPLSNIIIRVQCIKILIHNMSSRTKLFFLRSQWLPRLVMHAVFFLIALEKKGSWIALCTERGEYLAACSLRPWRRKDQVRSQAFVVDRWQYAMLRAGGRLLWESVGLPGVTTDGRERVEKERKP